MLQMEKLSYRKQGHPQNAEQGQGWEQTDINDTLNAFDSGETRTPTLIVDQGWEKSSVNITKDITPTLATTHGGEPVVLENHPADSRVKICKDNIFQTLSSRMGTGGGNVPMIEENNTVVRRLTPLECERLQGYPDNWTDIGEWTDSKGKRHKDADAPRYKALGNSIALPFWDFLAERIINELNEEKPTMASLFDGIGGFPLVFSRHGCEPVWASEIEEFPMAVTERRINDTN